MPLRRLVRHVHAWPWLDLFSGPGCRACLSSSSLPLLFRLNLLRSAPVLNPSPHCCHLILRSASCPPSIWLSGSFSSILLLHCATSAYSVPPILPAVSILSTLLAEIVVLPSSGAAISVLLGCSRNDTLSVALWSLNLLLGRCTSSCVFPWPRALGQSCPPPRWGRRCPVLPPPSSRSCCSCQLRPQAEAAHRR